MDGPAQGEKVKVLLLPLDVPKGGFSECEQKARKFD